MMRDCTRKELMLFRARALSYGRRLISAEALAELARRATVDRVWAGCGERRVQTVCRLIRGRREQVIRLLIDASPVEGASQYIPVIDGLADLHAQMQAAEASEAVTTLLEMARRHRLTSAVGETQKKA